MLIHFAYPTFQKYIGSLVEFLSILVLISSPRKKENMMLHLNNALKISLSRIHFSQIGIYGTSLKYSNSAKTALLFKHTVVIIILTLIFT